jgi:methionyl-tRNA synthetase
MALADRANQYIESNEPWKLNKDETKAEELRDVCSIGLNLFRQIAVYLAPVLPRLTEQTGELLNAPINHWGDAQTPLTGTPVSPFKHMMKRVDLKQVENMVEESREGQGTRAEGQGEQQPSTLSAQPSAYNDGPEALEQEPLTTEQCTFDDFMKIDMRVARVVEAEHVEGADKLLKLKLSLGGEETRTVFAGIKSCYAPEELVGRLVVCCANLAPRKMRFGVSEGMVLASGPGGKGDFPAQPRRGSQAGDARALRSSHSHPGARAIQCQCPVWPSREVRHVSIPIDRVTEAGGRGTAGGATGLCFLG